MQGRTSDFSTVAARYDATRHIPENVLARCFETLTRHGILPGVGKILDVGCGTGQISLPLAKIGLDVTGIDVAEPMVFVANSKVQPGQAANYEIGDARSIAYADCFFHAVVFSKLLMHVEDWKQCCSEFVRVVKPRSYVIQLVDWGTFSDSVRREFTKRVNDLGFADRFLGAVSYSGEIAACMSQIGCDVSLLEETPVTWTVHRTRRQSLTSFADRLFAEFWYMPVDIYDRVLSGTYDWAEGQPGGLDEPEVLTGHLRVEAYQRRLGG